MTETKLLEMLKAALAGRSPERAVQDLGLRYNQARTLRNAIDGASGWGKKVLGILLMLDPSAGPLVLEYLKEEVGRWP
jgi:hypothetical protein